MLTFYVEPVDIQQANAHLAVNEPNGVVVVAPPRGPKGGWGNVVYVTGEERLSPRSTRSRTFHIVVR